VKVLAAALEGGKSSQAFLYYTIVGLRFLLSVGSHTLDRVPCVQMADARLTLISLFKSKSGLKCAAFGLGGA